jgi:hypothetical protein
MTCCNSIRGRPSRGGRPQPRVSLSSVISSQKPRAERHEESKIVYFSSSKPKRSWVSFLKHIRAVPLPASTCHTPVPYQSPIEYHVQIHLVCAKDLIMMWSSLPLHPPWLCGPALSPDLVHRCCSPPALSHHPA